MFDSVNLGMTFGRLHMVAVHMPIALVLVAVWFEFVGGRRSREHRTWAVRACLALGLAAAAFTAASGWQLAENEPLGRSLENTLFWHRWTGVGVSAVTLAALVLGSRRRVEGKAPKGSRPVLLLAALTVGAAGHLGGTLVHGEGFLFPSAPEAVPDPVPETAPETAPLAADPEADGEAAAAPTVDYATQIQPLFAARCYECHGEQKSKGKLRLNDMTALFERPDAKQLIHPGHPELSEVYKRVTLPPEDLDIMPARGDPLSPEQVDLIRRWIAEGAPHPSGG